MTANIRALVREAIEAGNDRMAGIMAFVGEGVDKRKVLTAIEHWAQSNVIARTGRGIASRYKMLLKPGEVPIKKKEPNNSWHKPYTIEQLDAAKSAINPSHKATGAVWSALAQFPMNARHVAYVTGKSYAEVNRTIKAMATHPAVPTAEGIDGGLYRLRKENVWKWAIKNGIDESRWDTSIAGPRPVTRKTIKEKAKKIALMAESKTAYTRHVEPETVEQFLARGGVIEQAVTEFKFERLTHKQIMSQAFRFGSEYQTPISPRLSTQGKG